MKVKDFREAAKRRLEKDKKDPHRHFDSRSGASSGKDAKSSQVHFPPKPKR